jgi:DNA-binding GntR family transcriptional regulator
MLAHHHGGHRPGGRARIALRAFTAREIDDAIALRGQLEGMAARLVAEHGVTRGLARTLHAALAEGDAALVREHVDVARRNLKLILDAGEAFGPAALITRAAEAA